MLEFSQDTDMSKTKQIKRKGKLKGEIKRERGIKDEVRETGRINTGYNIVKNPENEWAALVSLTTIRMLIPIN